MKGNKTDILELKQEEFENAVCKNYFIAHSNGDILVFLNQSVTNGREIEEVLDSYDFLKESDVLIFGDGVPEGKMNLIPMLESFQMDIFAIVVKREVLEHTGCFNTQLAKMTNYEFLCRTAESATVYGIACTSGMDMPQEVSDAKMRVNAGDMAYILRKYMVYLQNEGCLNELFERISTYMKLQDAETLGIFNDTMSLFLDHDELFVKIAVNTAPFLIISGDETCHGVLKDFALSLASELKGMGQAVLTTGHEYGRFNGFEELEKKIFKGVIGFQAPILVKPFFQKIKGRKFQFWFDNPLFFDDLFQNLPDDYYFLCQDQFYAQHLQRFYHVGHAIQFPPAGKDAGYAENTDRMYEIVFIGAYTRPDEGMMKNPFEQEFYEYMLANPNNTFEVGLTKFLGKKNIKIQEEEFLKLLWSLENVCRCVNWHFRKEVVETILSAGFPLHVFGDTWYAYEGKGKENLIIHPAVSVDESLKILGQARIGLNVMTWHKAGMTERIANIMLSGSVCLSDETVYLREHFEENEEIVLFELNHLEQLPEKIRKVLENEEYRSNIAKKAYQKAASEHTWRNRAEGLLKITG